MSEIILKVSHLKVNYGGIQAVKGIDLQINNGELVTLIGANGAGKTTFAREFLPREADCPVFVNADLIAAGLSPFAPERAAIQAGRLMLESVGGRMDSVRQFRRPACAAGFRQKKHAPLPPGQRAAVALWWAIPHSCT